MSHLVVRAFPVLDAKKEEELKRMVSVLAGSMAEAAADFYRRYNIIRESWHIQRIHQGSILIAVTELDAPPSADAVDAYAASNDPFEAWFKGCVEDWSGINLDLKPLGPPSKCIFDWP